MRINNDEPVLFFTSSSNYTTPESTPSPIDDSILRPFSANIENNNYDLYFRNLSINEHNQQQLQQQEQNQNQNQLQQQQLHQNQYQQEQLKSAKVDNYSATASSSSSSATPAPAPVARKMSKRACDSCNVRKIFCDGKQPCESCNRAKINCTFLKTHLRPGPRKPRVKTFQLINSSQVDWKQGQGRGRKRRRSGSSDDDAASNPTSGTGEGSATGVSGAKSSVPAAVSEAKRCSIPLKVNRRPRRDSQLKIWIYIPSPKQTPKKFPNNSSYYYLFPSPFPLYFPSFPRFLSIYIITLLHDSLISNT